MCRFNFLEPKKTLPDPADPARRPKRFLVRSQQSLNPRPKAAKAAQTTYQVPPSDPPRPCALMPGPPLSRLSTFCQDSEQFAKHNTFSFPLKLKSMKQAVMLNLIIYLMGLM